MAKLIHLLSVGNAFHARVLVARLGAEGIGVELRGLAEGPYPLPGEVALFVTTEDESLAREVLLADQVDAAFAPALPRAPRRSRRRLLLRRREGA